MRVSFLAHAEPAMNVPALPAAVRRLASACALVLLSGGDCSTVSAQEPSAVAGAQMKLRVGGYVQNINPRQLPVPVNGGFVQRMADRVIDPLAARTLVIAADQQTASITIVDSCLLPRDLVDAAKQRAAEQTGISPQRMLVAATHAHSVPAVQGIHGSEASQAYRGQLTEQIARSIIEAHARLRPAEVGWASRPLEQFVYCRRWLMQPGTALTIPFTGRDTNQVQMNPGHGNANKIRPVGPVDPEVMVLAFRDSESGRALAVLGNWNTHYAGAPALSSDYFGHVGRKLGARLPAAADDFVALMSNGTSGDANCIDFSQPQRVPFDAAEVADAVMEKAVAAYRAIDNWQSDLPLRMLQQEIRLGVRMPTADEVAKAREVTASWIDQRLPQSMREVYQRETILLSEMPPTRDVVLQTLRLGDFALAATPCEVYGSTGLHIKRHSPFPCTMNIGWANDYLGYLPPPEHFALGGYTTWRARSSCLEPTAEPQIRSRLLRMLAELRGEAEPPPSDSTRRTDADGEPEEDAPGDAAEEDVNEPANRRDSEAAYDRQPIPPRASLGRLSVPVGYRLELAAAEPQVVDPVSLAFDARGRMWVVEMRDYPTGPPAGTAPRGRLRVLEDRDHDGYFERAVTFADGLLFPTGVLPWRDGVVVTLAGRVAFLADRDGDGRADASQTWFTGFAEENEQLRANHPTWTLEQRIHIANGLRGGVIRAQDRRWSDDAQPLQLRGSDFEFDPRGGDFAAVAGNSQFGFYQDAVGRRYVCSNRNPCRLLMGTRDAVAGNPLLPPEQWVVDLIPAAEQSRVRGLVDGWTTSNLHAGQFTAACGVFRYESDLLPSLEGDFFVCEPTSSAVCRYRTVGDGLVPQAVRAQSPIEFITSTDPWFRPVDLSDGPDGALYIVDMHRAVIEHPQWVPEEWKAAIDQRCGQQAGRIYRLVPSDRGNERRAGEPVASLAVRSDRDLAELLGDANRWRRTTAARLLCQRAADDEVKRAEIAAAVGELWQRHPSDLKRAMASLWQLVGLRRISSEDLLRALHSDAPALRAAGLRVAARLSSRAGDHAVDAVDEAEVRQRLAALSADPDDRVRYAWLLYQAGDAEGIATALQPQPAERPAARWLGAAASRWDPGWLPTVFDHLVDAGSDRQAWLVERLEPWVRRGGWEKAAPVLASLLLRPSEDAITSQLLSAYLAGLRGGGHRLDPLLAELPAEPRARWAQLREQALGRAADGRLSAKTRRQALPVALAIDDARSRGLAWELLRGGEPQFVSAAVRAICREPVPATQIVAELKRLPPRAAATLVSTAATSDHAAAALVRAVDRGELDGRLIPPQAWQQLVRHTLPEIGQLATQLRRRQTRDDRAALVRDYLAAMDRLADPADAASGKRTFGEHCANCHRVDGVGVEVGPTISDLRTQTSAQLVEAILHPNAAIDADYFRYRVLTVDGRVAEGRLIGGDEAALTLELAGGQRLTVRRDAIEQFEATGQSLMPEGFEAQLDPRQLRDLVHYLKTWRIEALR